MMARDLPPGVSQHSVDQCKDQIKDQFSKDHKSVQISDVDEKSKSFRPRERGVVSYERG